MFGINNDIFTRAGGNPLVTIGRLQDNVLGSILSNRTLSKLIDAEAAQGASAYTLPDLFTDLKKGIWTELPSRAKIDVYRRNLQKSYVNTLSNLLNPPTNTGITLITLGGPSSPQLSSDKSDVRSMVRAHLTTLRAEVRAAASATSDQMSRHHLQDVAARIDKALDPKN